MPSCLARYSLSLNQGKERQAAGMDEWNSLSAETCDLAGLTDSSKTRITANNISGFVFFDTIIDDQ
jgi:hypothetical protein